MGDVMTHRVYRRSRAVLEVLRYRFKSDTDMPNMSRLARGSTPKRRWHWKNGGATPAARHRLLNEHLPN